MSTKLDTRTAIWVSAAIWLGHLAVIVTSSLGTGDSGALQYQIARLLVAGAGFTSTIVIHFLLPARAGTEFSRNLSLALLLSLPAAAVLTLYSSLQFRWMGSPMDRGILYDFAFSFAYYFWIYVSWSMLYAGLRARQVVFEQARRVAEIESQAHQAQLLALRYQLNPHFFFNVLNTLSGLISGKRLAEAEAVIINMADFLRYSLAGLPTALVTLRDELAAQRNYLDIERVRFGSRLVTKFDIGADCELACVPALILQPLVENAVKHGVSRSDVPIEIMVTARQDGQMLECVVENGAVNEGVNETEGLGVGLRNVAQRLEAVYGNAAQLVSGPTSAGGWRSAFRIPFQQAS